MSRADPGSPGSVVGRASGDLRRGWRRERLDLLFDSSSGSPLRRLRLRWSECLEWSRYLDRPRSFSWLSDRLLRFSLPGVFRRAELCLELPRVLRVEASRLTLSVSLSGSWLPRFGSTGLAALASDRCEFAKGRSSDSPWANTHF